MLLKRTLSGKDDEDEIESLSASHLGVPVKKEKETEDLATVSRLPRAAT